LHCRPRSGARPLHDAAISSSARVTHGKSVTDTVADDARVPIVDADTDTVNDADT
jgi:hypothetical protein